MKSKFLSLAFASAILISAFPAGLRAADGTTPAPTPSGKHGGCACGGHHGHHKHHHGNGKQTPAQ